MIKSDKRNYRKHNDKNKELIKKSLEECGAGRSIVIDNEDEIICGNGIYEQAQKLGIKTKIIETDGSELVVVKRTDLKTDDDKRKQLAVMDNSTSDSSEFDLELLQTDFETETLQDWGIDVDFQLDDKEIIEDEVPEEVETRCKSGDIWQLENHRLMCGDSTKIEDVEKLMNGELADLLITDPPYNVNYEGKTKDHLKIQNDKMSDLNFREFLRDAFECANAVMKAGAVFYIWHADSEGYNFRGACIDAGWQVRQCLIWNKNQMILGRQDYHWKHEPCQPAGTKVLTPNGYVPIEKLKDGDRVVSFDTLGGTVKGYREGLEIKTASRDYKGLMYKIKCDGKETRATDNHQFSVRFNSENHNNYCVYLMKRGDWFRVGISRMYDSRGFGVKDRFRTEKAESCWILTVCANKSDAQIQEQICAVKYGIPYTCWEADLRSKNSNYNQRCKEQVKTIYNSIDLNNLKTNAEKLLEDFGRNIKFPLITKGEFSRFSRRVTAKINACNLIPEIMQLPIPFKKYDGNKTFKWESISKIEFEQFDGKVYSLAVDKYEHYIADGIITHNCLYGWKDGASHLWASDRKQTTVIDFDKPQRSGEHPTMKPVGLFDYQIKNNTKGSDIVLDLFGGSGTTLIACEQDGRKARVMELDPKYCSVIIQRWENLTGKKAELINGK